MIDTGGLRKGLTIELDGQLHKIVDYKHIKIARGSAQVRLKLKNLQSGHTTEKTFQAGSRFAVARIERRSAQYLYRDGDFYIFMDQETFDQTPLTTELLDDTTNYLIEGMTVDIISHGDVPIDVELPFSVELAISDTDPGFKGDTAQGGTKPATLETGLIVQVPLFVNPGDRVKVDTRTGEYQERV